MKKLLSFLVISVMLAFVTVTVPAATRTGTAMETGQGLRNGIIKSFTESSITVMDSGKTYILPFAKDIKIVKMGEPSTIMEAAKGLKIKYRAVMKNNVPATVNYIDIPASGTVFMGIPGTSVSFEQEFTYTSEVLPVDKVSTNVNSLFEATKTIVTSGDVESSEYVAQSNQVLFIGAYNIIPGSLSLSIGGKDIRIIDSNAEFNPLNPSDEAKLTINGAKEIRLNLESPLSKEQFDDADNVVKLNYKYKQYKAIKQDITNLVVNEEVYTELNGKEVSYAKALYRGNYVEFSTNDRSEISYVNAYYKDLKAVVESVKGDKLSITAIRSGNPSFQDMLTMNAGCTILDLDGKEIAASDLHKGDNITVTTSPDLGYQVVEIVRTN